MDEIQGVTMRLGQMVLDACEQRQQVLANNIANVNVPGYRPLRLDFENQLGALQSAVTDGADDKTLEALIGEVKPQVVPRPADAVTGDPQQRLDEEMTLVAQNSLQYEAVLTALAREGMLNKIAITGEM